MPLTLLPVPQPRVRHWPYVALGTLQLLDVATTYVILAHWSQRAEGNPIAAFFIDYHLVGGLGLLLVLKLLVVAIFWSCQTPVRIAAVIYSAVILNNSLFLFLWLTRYR